MPGRWTGGPKTVPDLDGPHEPLYHLTVEREWREAVERGGPYRRSTLGKSQDAVGCIHCLISAQETALQPFAGL
jgi:hypothetical protein